MRTVPLVGFAGYSGVGKTTLIEQIVAQLTGRGLRVAVLKHDGHDFQMDQPGKDTERFAQAGAAVTVLTSAAQTVRFENRGRSWQEAAALAGEVDFILVEGWKQGAFAQVGLSRGELALPGPPERYIALVSDRAEAAADVPLFGFEEAAALTEFLLENQDRLCTGVL